MSEKCRCHLCNIKLRYTVEKPTEVELKLSPSRFMAKKEARNWI